MKPKLYTWCIPKQWMGFNICSGQPIHGVKILFVLTDATHHSVFVPYNKWLLINGRYDLVSEICLKYVKEYINRWNDRFNQTASDNPSPSN